MEAKLVYASFVQPLLLLGRSGTGKTTVAVHRMWRLYCSGVLRFVFVTASAQLRDRVRTLFRRTQRGAGLHAAAATGERCDAAGGALSLERCSRDAWPLFLTTADWMRLLDGACAKPFFARTPDGALTAPEKAPASWRPRGAPEPKEQPNVDFRFFLTRLWPRLVSHDADGITRSSTAAVWREFVSFIKGGAHQDLDRSGQPLSRAEYLALPHKIAPAFATEKQRAAVYALYEKYEALKRTMQMYDTMDIACSVARQQRIAPLGASEFSLAYIFVDEVQDLTQIELLTLAQAVQQPSGLRSGGSLFLAGDTAQAITLGVGFRFEDTKALLFRAKTLHPHWGTPTLSSLTVNYRAQNGLVCCAAAVGELLIDLFPASVDRLPRERGFFRGTRPVLVLQTEREAIIKTFVPPDDSTEVSVFGAKQCVLVRNEAGRARLLAEEEWLSDMGATILTVEESKGLEFGALS
jgi:DNA polymerase III delta prime subunit